jgi:hypothetical protein
MTALFLTLLGLSYCGPPVALWLVATWQPPRDEELVRRIAAEALRLRWRQLEEHR